MNGFSSCLYFASELLHTDLRYSVSFPIHRELPRERPGSFGLTFPPRAEVLVPKTHYLLLQPVPISLVLACGSERQDGSSLPQEVASFVAVPLPSAESCGHAARTHIGQGTLHGIASIHLLKLRSPAHPLLMPQ
ncbi:hypothetical protein MiSe_85220 [Microseira wollei NIES-4236]|uniref:Uncharacterized protein n=1 Tax=Microseira wollei NIES-4236 TaxID=2530354 RepID=A0AAV3XLA2_9CYAN|nr:hypothetical protein MiSe_85220 [Microseira wollei NIES-4236]